MKIKCLILLSVNLLLSNVLLAQEAAQHIADKLNGDAKMNAVIVIAFIVLVGFVVGMLRLEFKIRALEKLK